MLQFLQALAAFAELENPSFRHNNRPVVQVAGPRANEVEREEEVRPSFVHAQPVLLSAQHRLPENVTFESKVFKKLPFYQFDLL